MKQQLKNKLASGAGFVTGGAAGIVGENMLSTIDWDNIDIDMNSEKDDEIKPIAEVANEPIDTPIDEPFDNPFEETNYFTMEEEDDLFANSDYINDANVDDYLA